MEPGQVKAQRAAHVQRVNTDMWKATALALLRVLRSALSTSSRPPTYGPLPHAQPPVRKLPMRSRVFHVRGQDVSYDCCISGLVVEYIVAIDVTRVRFPADAFSAVDSNCRGQHVLGTAVPGPGHVFAARVELENVFRVAISWQTS